MNSFILDLNGSGYPIRETFNNNSQISSLAIKYVKFNVTAYT